MIYCGDEGGAEATFTFQRREVLYGKIGLSDGRTFALETVDQGIILTELGRLSDVWV